MAIDDETMQRLLEHGPAAMSNRDLFRILDLHWWNGKSLSEGDSGSGAMMVREVAAESLMGLQVKGRVTQIKAAKLAAAIELGRRLPSEGRSPKPMLRTPADIAKYLMPKYSAEPIEKFGVMLLTVRHQLKFEGIVSVGCLTSSLVHPREVFKAAVEHSAAALVLFHNHPSGDPEPSAEDVSLTRRLVSAGVLMGIEVLDHLVVGAGRYVSFKERGLV